MLINTSCSLFVVRHELTNRTIVTSDIWNDLVIYPAISHYHFWARRLSVERNSYSDVAGWLGGWLAVTLRYCIKTAKPIGKLFRQSESPITIVFWDPCAIQNFKGNPFSGGVKYTGGGKIGDFRLIFDVHRCLSRKRCEIGRWLPWNVNRKS